MSKFLWHYFKDYVGTILIIIICSVLTAFVDLFVQRLLAVFIDEILVSKDLEKFYLFILLLASISLLMIITHRIGFLATTKMKTKIANQMITNFINQVYRLRSEFILNTDMIYLSKRIDFDLTAIVNFAVDNLMHVCTYFSKIVLAIFFLTAIGFKWLIIFIIVASSHVILYHSLEKTLYKRSLAVREADANYFTALSDNFLYVYSIKLHGLYREYILRFKKSFAEFFSAVVKEAELAFWFRYSNINSNELFKVLIFLLGGLDVLDGTLKIGNFVALTGYCILAMEGVSYFMSLGQSYQDANAAYTRIMEIKNLPPEINGTKILERINSIEVRNVSFSFGEQKILTDFSKTFLRGKIYCIVGKNGAGKSTLMNLICGMIRPNGGEIFFSDESLTEIDMIHARKNLIAVVEQKDFIKNDKLSGGERRRISINTALKKSADVLIMDEPDNNLDIKAVDEVIEKILDEKENRITLIISHDERFMNISDEIINFNIGGD